MRCGAPAKRVRAKASFDADDMEAMSKYLIKPNDLVRERKIGEGAYGVVYKGTWRHVEVAIKEVKVADPARKRSI